MKICSGCGGPNTRTGQNYCLKCHYQAQKKYLLDRILVPYRDLCIQCRRLATVKRQMATKRKARARAKARAKADSVTVSKGAR